MNDQDYDLMILICQHLLRKSHDLNYNQISDIDQMIKKLYKEKQRSIQRALVRNQKMGKRQGI